MVKMLFAKAQREHFSGTAMSGAFGHASSTCIFGTDSNASLTEFPCGRRSLEHPPALSCQARSFHMLWFHMPSSLPGFAVRKHRLSYGSNKVEKYSACRNQVVVSATEVECLCRFMSLVCLEEAPGVWCQTRRRPSCADRSGGTALMAFRLKSRHLRRFFASGLSAEGFL